MHFSLVRQSDLHCSISTVTQFLVETTVENLKLGLEPQNREADGTLTRTSIPLTSTSIRPHLSSPGLDHGMEVVGQTDLRPQLRLLVDPLYNTGSKWYRSQWFSPQHAPSCSIFACGILVPRPGVEPVPPAVEAQSPNHWTAREFPLLVSFLKGFIEI